MVKATTYRGSANITCDVIYHGNPKIVQLEKLVWIRNFTIIAEGSVAIAPITVTKATTRDGGDYVCGAKVKLMTTTMRQITMGTATLNIQLKMVNGTTQVQGAVSSNVVMECPAEGYPLNVTWFRVNEDGQENNISKILGCL
ncbi:hypothetical protein QZH41_011134, partial [Actinostola sp. cb2023]